MNDDGVRCFGYTPEHRVTEVTRIGRGTGAIAPQPMREIGRPCTVVICKLRNVTFFSRAAQKEMLQNCVVQDRDAWFSQRALVNLAMKLIVAKLINGDIACSGIRFDRRELLHSVK